MKIQIGARSSPLSRAQVDEVLLELRAFHPEISFDVTWVETLGDRDKTTSLRSLDKTDFFTRELDERLLAGSIQAAIHSAKDLPDPIPRGLSVAAVTRGVDPRDVLVFQKSLPERPLIATSSERREEAVKNLFPNARFVDLRGTIGERLAKLEKQEVDAVVLAEAALIRLKLTHLLRLFIPGETVPLQGRLAILTRAEDTQMQALFAKIDA